MIGKGSTGRFGVLGSRLENKTWSVLGTLKMIHISKPNPRTSHPSSHTSNLEPRTSNLPLRGL